jgi:hypothetical protein
MRRRGLVFVLGFAVSMPVSAFADDFGCTVLMCLSNPAGWGSVVDCVTPVTKMFELVARGGSFSCAAEGLPSVSVSNGKKWYDRWISYTDSNGQFHREYY